MSKPGERAPGLRCRFSVNPTEDGYTPAELELLRAVIILKQRHARPTDGQLLALVVGRGWSRSRPGLFA
jgi:hypothetical protein